MEDTIALIKAISTIVWPICLVLIVFIFRKEIRTVLLSLIKKQNGEMEGEKTPETQIPAPTLQGHKKVISQADTAKITSDDQLTVEACKNISSGKYFIILDEDKYEIKTIAPNGNINSLEKKIFYEAIENITIDKLTEIQREKVYKWIENIEPVAFNMRNVTRQPIDGYLPSYQGMLNNPNTEPSRMLAYIKSKGTVTWFEVKQYLHETYDYELTSGSMGASLKALETLGLVTINGQGDDKIITYVGPKR
jgi:hypothetical protein